MDLRIYKWLIITCSVFLSASADPSLQILKVSIKTPRPDYTGKTAALINDLCDVSVNIRTSFSKKYNGTPLELQVALPYQVASSHIGLCGHRLWSKESVSCVQVASYQTHSQMVFRDGVLQEKPSVSYTSTNHTLSFLIPSLSRSFSDSEIRFKFKLKILPEVMNVGEVHNFHFTTYFGSLKANKSASLRILGPKLIVSSDSADRIVDVGDSTNGTLKVNLSPSSTEDAEDIVIQLSHNTAGVTAQMVTGTTTHTLPLTINKSKLKIGQCLHIYVKFQVSEKAHIGHPINFKLAISYKSDDDHPHGYKKYETNQVASVGKVRDIKDVTTKVIGSQRLIPGSEMPVVVNFEMPKGVLPDLSFELDCSSYISPVPCALFYSHIKLGPHLVATDHKALIFTRDKGGIGLLRRKRSTSNRIFLSRPPVTISHPASSPLAYNAVVLNGNITTNAIGVDPKTTGSLPGGMTITMSMTYGKRRRVLRQVSHNANTPEVRLTKTYTYKRTEKGLPVFDVSLEVEHLAASAVFMNGTVTDDIYGLSPSNIKSTGAITKPLITSNKITVGFNITTGNVFRFTYLANMIDKKYFRETYSYRNADVVYRLAGSPLQTTISSYGCVYRKIGVEEVQNTAYGFIAILFFAGLLVGLVILLVIGILYICLVKSGVNPFDELDASDESAMRETTDRLLLDEAALTGDLSTIKGLSNVNKGDSIVSTLINKNRQELYRKLDSLDILNSIYIDQGLENEYERLSIDAIILMLQNLTQHGTLNGNVVNRSVQRFQKNVETMDKEVQTQHKKEASTVMKELSRKNKTALQQMLSRHRKEKETLESELAGEDPNVQKEILGIQAKQHKAERDDLVHKLKLQQDEESEKLRKKFSLLKRSMLRDAERGLLDEIAEKNPLDPSQADWLLKEHRRIQSHLDQRYDTELARQRMLLEEKLERRRALAKKKELEEENQTELLNTLASQQVNIVRRLRRQGDLTIEQADEYLNRIKTDMLRAKEALDHEKEKQEQALLQRLNDRKRAQFEVNSANHQVEETQLMKELKAASVGTMMDPVVYIDAVMDLHVRHRDDLERTENQADEQDTEELVEEYRFSVSQTEAEIRLSKDDLLQQLRHDDVPDDELQQIVDRHNRELRQIQESHDEDRAVQEQNFKVKLAAKRKEMEQNLEQEKQEQELVRQHEDTMVHAMLQNQVSMSDAERDRILQEHERNMVQVENSLTLSKLRQKRMLEEALAERKAKQMEKLQKKQAVETDKKLKFTNEGEEEEDEKEHKDLIEMMRRHGEQKLELLQGDEIDMDDELETVRNKMMEERANALKEQEERIAAMLSSLQLEKAKELSRIEEQQKAINNLKMNLMDDLNQRGVLSDDRCQKIISRHQEEQERLVQHLDTQRDEQEQMLRERLRKRMELKEKQMNSEQKKKIDEKVQELPPRQRAQAQIRKAILLNKQMVEMEHFKNRMMKESNQSLEEAKRQFNVKKEQYLQDQELNFIAGLVQLGKFSKKELLDVLKVLFPLKKASEIEAILAKIHSGQDEKPSPSRSNSEIEENDPLSQSTLLDRTKVSFQGIGSITRFQLRSSKKKQNKGNLMTLSPGNNEGGLTPIDRPDPLGQDSPSVIPDPPIGRGGDLPPIESKKKKRKKKKRRNEAIEEEDEFDGRNVVTVNA